MAKPKPRKKKPQQRMKSVGKEIRAALEPVRTALNAMEPQLTAAVEVFEGVSREVDPVDQAVADAIRTRLSGPKR